MFSKKSSDTAAKNKLPTENTLLDALCELAVERHFQNYIKTASKYKMSHELVERVDKMKKLAMEATGGHKIVK